MKFIYVWIDVEKNLIETSGIRFYDFYHGIVKKPNNILMLKGRTTNSLYNENLRLEYMVNEQIVSFMQLCHHGDFCWVDFVQEENLDHVADKELSELLFIAHKFEPLNSFKFDCIDNKYTYCSHDDEYLTRIYMDVEKYVDVIEFVVLNHLKQNNKILFSGEIKNRLFQFSQSGIIFDFEQNSDSIKFYIVQKTKIDDIYEKLIKCRKQGNGWYLTIRNNKWILEKECK